MATLTALSIIAIVATSGPSASAIDEGLTPPRRSITATPHLPGHDTQTASPAGDNVARWHRLIKAASREFGVPEAWIVAVITAESDGMTKRNGRPITSSAGAMGLMQLMPSTWSEMRDRYGLGTDPYDPKDNIMAGTAYLSRLFERYGYPDMFAAYNAGPGHFNAYLRGESPLPAETQRYLQKLTNELRLGRLTPETKDKNSLFFVLTDGNATASMPAANSLFLAPRTQEDAR